jgi:hypothetical protein
MGEQKNRDDQSLDQSEPRALRPARIGVARGLTRGVRDLMKERMKEVVDQVSARQENERRDQQGREHRNDQAEIDHVGENSEAGTRNRQIEPHPLGREQSVNGSITGARSGFHLRRR